MDPAEDPADGSRDPHRFGTGPSHDFDGGTVVVEGDLEDLGEQKRAGYLEHRAVGPERQNHVDEAVVGQGVDFPDRLRRARLGAVRAVRAPDQTVVGVRRRGHDAGVDLRRKGVPRPVGDAHRTWTTPFGTASLRAGRAGRSRPEHTVVGVRRHLAIERYLCRYAPAAVRPRQGDPVLRRTGPGDDAVRLGRRLHGGHQSEETAWVRSGVRYTEPVLVDAGRLQADDEASRYGPPPDRPPASPGSKRRRRLALCGRRSRRPRPTRWRMRRASAWFWRARRQAARAVSQTSRACSQAARAVPIATPTAIAP